MALPSGVNYGQVSWRALSAVADGSDEDGNPDSVAVNGTVTFTASIPSLAVGGIIDPITIFLTPVSYTLDRDGVLVDAQRRTQISLVATDTVSGLEWKWTASYRLNNGLVRGSVDFALPAGSVVDLTNPTVPLYNGTPINPPSGPVTGVDNGDGTFTIPNATAIGDGSFIFGT